MKEVMGGISALDPRIAATDQFIKDKQIPPDQVEDFLLSKGVDPRTVALLFKYRKVKEAASNQNQAPAPTSTVADDVTQQYAQMRQQRGLASMPAPVMANASMQGGITGEPEQRMAGGGVVALAGGGGLFSRLWRNKGKVALAGAAGATALGALDSDKDPMAGAKVEEEGDTDDLSPEDYKVLAGVKTSPTAEPAATKRTTMGTTPLPAAPKYVDPDFSQYTTAISEAEKRVPASRDAAYQEQLAREKELGQHKLIEDRLAKLDNQEKAAKMNPKQMFWLSISQAGFAASAKGAKNLTEVLAYGGDAGMKAYQGMKDKQDETLEKIADKKLELQNMEIAIKRGAMERGDKEFDDTRKELQSLRNQYSAQQAANTIAKNTRAGQEWETQVGDVSRRNAAAMQISAADARADKALTAQQNRMKLDQAIDDAILQSSNPSLTPEQRAAFKKRAAVLTKQRASKERTESGYQSAELRAAQQAATLGGGDDGFSNLE